MPAVTFELPDLVVVTGTSSGLGSEVAGLLLSCGVKVIGVDLSQSQSTSQVGYTEVIGSVAEQATWSRVRAAAEAASPARIGLVTSAAILDTGTVPDSTPDLIARAMAVNVTGTALGMAALIPLMEAAKGGSIVAVASVNASLAEQQLAIYNASKAAVRQLARTAALDHARSGVRINVLSPGPMMAGLFKRHLESASDSGRFLATRANRQPQGMIMEAVEVARAALFLLSDGASAILGADLIADGGLTTGFDFRTGAEGASV
ncbi:NAD(P)-dependent dehydrogenase (short-subunit alcohol dehydrogenase family) [Aminobacter lissarensis]|uniref:NAD(P)-dependent dehydrogenase (Short-subunit alcohol dehydrogenase family) n=1 Tax=Aminobacter carboxidus TaxID=376165 RepID=A0A8E1WKR9_9HYPH|nr:SDR family oxidoreductase [Aminobacter lissarensis]MBB6469151.1 NAD(P)-dependent dehydrogenase (short-subunit alcohol dehydrogenase family) [Aminobacter lissarensis]